MISIDLNRDSDQPLYAQIRDALKRDIAEGRLNDGDRLPPVATFAKNLGVTQSTIRRALEDLSKDGLTKCHVGRGTFVDSHQDAASEKPQTERPPRTPGWQRPASDGSHESALAARRMRMGIAKSLHALMPLTQRPGLIQFTSGIPDPTLFEPGLLSNLTGLALEQSHDYYHHYGDHMGLALLREALADRFSSPDTQITADQILITSGSQQAVSLMAQYGLENHHRILCEMPCYMGIPNAFGALGHWVEAIPRDTEGPDVEKLAGYPHDQPPMLYTCPDLHNPMGTDMSLDRRQVITRWVAEHGGMLIADEIFHDLHFQPPAAGRMWSHGDPRHTVTVGSLSKSFMCGLRIGWVVAAAEIIQSLTALKRAMDIGCPPLMQGVAQALLTSGIYDEHITRANDHYQKRCRALMKALKARMPADVIWTQPQGGFHSWITLPEGYSSIALFLSAIERGVAVIPGPFADVDHGFLSSFRLSYGSNTREEIAEGVDLLADAVTDLLQQPPRPQGLGGLGNFL